MYRDTMSTKTVCLLLFLFTSELTYAVPAHTDYQSIGPNGLPDTKSSTRCKFQTEYGVGVIDCSNRDFKFIPSTVRKDIEALNFSRNRMRGLDNDTLSSFTRLRFLYLPDNFITTIEDAAFVNLRQLEVLDLSANEPNNIPNNIYALPSLRTLRLCESRLTDRFMDPTPFADNSNLQILNLSMNDLTKLPRLGALPYLQYLNVSRNSIKSLNVDNLAAFCSLRILDISHNPVIIKTTTDSCECNRINTWITARNISMTPPKLNCPVKTENNGNSRCSYDNGTILFSNKTLEIYENCKNLIIIQEQSVKARSTWIIVASCVGSCLACLIVVLYCIRKRNKKMKLINIKKESANNIANDELLNGNATERIE